MTLTTTPTIVRATKSETHVRLRTGFRVVLSDRENVENEQGNERATKQENLVVVGAVVVVAAAAGIGGRRVFRLVDKRRAVAREQPIATLRRRRRRRRRRWQLVVWHQKPARDVGVVLQSHMRSLFGENAQTQH